MVGAKGVKVVAALALFGVAGYLAFGSIARLKPDGIDNGNRSTVPMPSPAERKRLEREFSAAVGLSPQEVQKLSRAFESAPREAMQMANSMLTSEQKTSAGLFMWNRMQERDARMAKMLSAEDMAAIRARRAEGMGRWMSRMGNWMGQQPPPAR